MEVFLVSYSIIAFFIALALAFSMMYEPDYYKTRGNGERATNWDRFSFFVIATAFWPIAMIIVCINSSKYNKKDK